MLTIRTSMGLDKLRTNVRNSFQPFIDRWDLTLPRVAALPNGYKRVLTHFHCALLLSPCPFSPLPSPLPFPFVLFAPLFSVAQLLSSHASGCNKQTVRPPSQASARIHRPPLLRGHLNSRAVTRPPGPACRRRIPQIGIGCAMDMLRSRRRRAASAGGEVECRGAAESPVYSRNGLEEILHSGSHSVCVCVCACARVRMPLCVCARACVRVCVCIYTRVRARACACVCARVCVCVDVVRVHALLKACE